MSFRLWQQESYRSVVYGYAKFEEIKSMAELTATLLVNIVIRGMAVASVVLLISKLGEIQV